VLCCRVRDMRRSRISHPVQTGALCRYHSRTQQESDAVTIVCSDFRRLYTFRWIPAQQRHRYFSQMSTVPQKSSPNAERWWVSTDLVPHHELPPKYLLMRIWCKVAAVCDLVANPDPVSCPYKTASSSGWVCPTCPPSSPLPSYNPNLLLSR